MCVWARAQINVMQQHIFAFERLAKSKKNSLRSWPPSGYKLSLRALPPSG